MKTTMSVFVTDGKKYLHGHLGDTRIYLLSEDRVLFQSTDHSVPQSLVTSGEIKLSDIRYHEDRNKLFRVLATEGMSTVDISEIKDIPISAKGVYLHGWILGTY